MHPYVYLAVAILADVAGASALKAADGFRQPLPSLLAVLGYGSAFFFLSLAVRTIPIGIANALWSGFSILLVAAVGLVVHREPLAQSTIAGLLLICSGTVLLNLGALVRAT
jgi:small multidrug resistance pump